MAPVPAGIRVSALTGLFHLAMFVHIVAGFAALIFYWTAGGARKGSRIHVQAGRLYALAMYVVAASAFVTAGLVVAAPAAIHPDRPTALASAFSQMLFIVGLAALSATWNGVRSARLTEGFFYRREIGVIFNLLTVAGAGRAAMLDYARITPLTYVFTAVIATGLWNAVRNLWFLRREPAAPRARGTRVQRHLLDMVDSGVVLHTAFWAGGAAGRYFPWLAKSTGVTFWILPAIVGIAVKMWLSRRRVPIDGADVPNTAFSLAAARHVSPPARAAS